MERMGGLLLLAGFLLVGGGAGGSAWLLARERAPACGKVRMCVKAPAAARKGGPAQAPSQEPSPLRDRLLDAIGRGESGYPDLADAFCEMISNPERHGGLLVESARVIPEDFHRWMASCRDRLPAPLRQTVSEPPPGAQVPVLRTILATYGVDRILAEKDPQVAARILRGWSEGVYPSELLAISTLLRVAREARDPALRIHAIGGLAARTPEFALLALREVADTETDAEVRSAAYCALYRLAPPAPGLLVLEPGPASAASSLRRGDLILSVDGESAVDSRRLLGVSSEPVKLGIYREGENLIVRLDGGVEPRILPVR